MYPFTVKAGYVKKCNQLYHLRVNDCRDKKVYQRGDVHAVKAFYRDSIVKSVLFI